MVAFALVPLIVALLLIARAPRQAIASLHLDVSAPREMVWAEIANFRRFPLFAKGGIEELPDQKGLPAWKEKAGRVGAFVVTRESEPPDRVVRESRMSASMVFWWSFRLGKEGGGTRVSLGPMVALRGGPLRWDRVYVHCEAVGRHCETRDR
jgi:hypothetical protein